MTTETRAFGRYELRGVLGHGGFATVYRAYDPALQREVALKTLLPHLAAEQEIRDRFSAEARALAALHHAHIVTIYDVGEADGLPFFAMELIEGSTLAAWLANGAPPRARALAWLADLASALDYLHAAGLVHRDVKPANIMVGPNGQAVLMDLGVARSLDSTRHTMTGVSMGTPAYMSREQVRGQPAGAAADIYALGILAFALLAGHAPFQGDTAAVLHAQVYDAPPLAELPPADAAALGVALAKEPALRPPSASALVAALRGESVLAPTLITPPNGGTTLPLEPAAALAATELHTPAPAAPPTTRRSGGSARLIIILGGVLVTIVLVIGTLALVLTHRTAPTPIACCAPPNPSIAPTAASVVMAAVTTIAPPAQNSVPSAAPSAAATQPPAAATLAPSATPPPTAAPAFSATTLTIDSNAVSAWATGGSALNAQVAFQHAPPGATLLLRISPADDPANPIAQGGFTTLGGSSDGSVNVAAPPAGAVSPGNYVALVFLIVNGQWTQQPVASRAFAVAPPSAPTVPANSTNGGTSLPAALDLSYPIAGGGEPGPHIIAVTQDNAPVAGGIFSFTVQARNDGATSGSGSISISSPDAVVISATPLACGATAVQPMNKLAGQTDTIFAGGGFYTGTLGYPLGELDFDTFPSGAVCSLHVIVNIAPSAGTLRLYLRTSVFDAGRALVTWPAASGTFDQQNLPVVPWTVPLH